VDSLDNHNSPWITTLIVGLRGSGKTSLLAGIQNLLKELDIVIVAMTPEGEFLDNILSQVYRQLPKSKLKSLPKLKSIKTPVGHGTLAFTYPYMGEFLQRKKQIGY